MAEALAMGQRLRGNAERLGELGSALREPEQGENRDIDGLSGGQNDG